MAEKLHKLLAQAGYGSRRSLEQWIAQGRVQINGQIAQLGDKVTLGQITSLAIDCQPVPLNALRRAAPQLLLYHKPLGELVTRCDPAQRPTVFSKLPQIGVGRWITVGRLDINTSGLLLLTTDGNLAHRLMHPCYQIEREYRVRVFGAMNRAIVERLRRGLVLPDGPACFHMVQHQGGAGLNQWFKVVLKEGRNRIVRRLWASQGITVSRLIRVRYGSISLPHHLSPGKWILLPSEALESLSALCRGST